MNLKNWLRALFCLVLFVASVAAEPQADSKPAQEIPKPERSLAAKRLHLTAKTPATPKLVIVFEGEPSPEVRAWADEASQLVMEWWPQICRLLVTDDFAPPEKLSLFFKRELNVPGYRTPEGIFISVPYITDHPDDFGMLIHEMTHAIQNYKDAPRNAGWLVEGIADYIRYWHYEPELRHPRINWSKASYRDGYRTTGAFLAWLITKHDRRIVRRLDAALREGIYRPELFQELAGKDLDGLWADFVAEHTR